MSLPLCNFSTAIKWFPSKKTIVWASINQAKHKKDLRDIKQMTFSFSITNEMGRVMLCWGKIYDYLTTLSIFEWTRGGKKPAGHGREVNIKSINNISLFLWWHQHWLAIVWAFFWRILSRNDVSFSLRDIVHTLRQFH